MPEITFGHIRQAAEWAKTAQEPCAIDGEVRKYDQSDWDCGTACCMWGAASLMSGNGPAKTGPDWKWASTDIVHVLIAGLLRLANTKPEQVTALLDRGADLTGADLTDANLRGADLTGADLTDANLRGADLTDADLTDAVIRLGNRDMKLA